MQFKKLRKIFRIIFPLVLSRETVFENKLGANALITAFTKENGYYKLKVKNDFELYIRDANHSDLKVFEQIFNNLEYNTVLQLLLLNPIFSERKVIIDAGANIGCTSVLFSNHFPKATIIAIEPCPENFKVLEKNIELGDTKVNFKTYPYALSQKAGTLFSLERAHEEPADWGIQTAEDLKGSIEGITLDEIIKENQLDFISLLKIDIEGAERFLFEMGSDLSFLKITQLIAIEIHDEYNIRSTILDVLREHDFIVFDTSETTIGIHKSIFK
jgi:FkbM family methyltransferase